MWPYMVKWGIAHFLVLFFAIIFIVAGCIFLPKLKPKYQNAFFWLFALSCTFVILWRFIIYYEHYSIDVLFRITLQVCNFNYFILPLACIKKFKFVKHYLFFTQAQGALFMFFAGDGFVASAKVYDLGTITYWYYHWVPIAFPIFMIACKQFYPERKYILPNFVATLGYYYIVTIGNNHLMKHRGYDIISTFSNTYQTSGNSILSALYAFLPVPTLYLVPVFLFCLINCYIVTYIFEIIRESKNAKGM